MRITSSNIFLSDSCPYNDADKFDATFHNSDVYPIDIIQLQPYEGIKKSGLSPENEVTITTSFTHLWEFVRSDESARSLHDLRSVERLMVKGNGITSIIFEGCNFKVKPNERITVNITRGNKAQIIS